MEGQHPRDTARAMSEENVERARRGLEAFNGGDVEAATADMHPDVEWRPLGEMAFGDVVVGREAVRRFWREWRETFEGFRLIIDDVKEAPVGALATTRAIGRGLASGMELTAGPFFQVFTIEDGKLRKLAMFTDREQALEAAGLSE